MDEFIPEFRNISNWDKQAYSSTGGTRAKKIYTNPTDNTSYFFKGSKVVNNIEIRYPEEFWSEIVASKIGKWLGFYILDYNIAYDQYAKQKCGCLSQSMISEENILTEGIEYLRGYNPKYDPVKNENEYTFDFISNALYSFGLDNSKNQFVEMLIFDSLISNSDRHQENWGFISLYDKKNETLNTKLGNTRNPFKKLWFRLHKRFVGIVRDMNDRKTLPQDATIPPVFLSNQSILIKSEFSPIYDSGCCLGRELNEDRVFQFLSNPDKLNKYIENGKAEVRWDIGQKISHFELVSKLKTKRPEIVADIQKRIRSKFDLKTLKDIVTNIDKQSEEHCQLPNYRKELMIKILSLRIEKFLSL